MTVADARIFVAGHRGMVGSSIARALERRGCRNIVSRSHGELDLTDQQAVRSFFETESPEQVYLAAARVGGIYANNTYPAEFIYDNLMIEANVIHEAWRAGVDRLLFLGSSCIYPKLAAQPMNETALLTGQLEPTNEPYAIAKIAGIKLCESYNRQYNTDFRSLMPTNLYGPGDNYHPDNSHVIPALIRRFHEAKKNGEGKVVIWGTGRPRREFLYVDDLAEASVFTMGLDRARYYSFVEPACSHLNVGVGEDVTIAELAEKVAAVIGFQGEMEFDHSKPDGTPRKLLDVGKLNKLGWKASTGLVEGLKKTYDCYLDTIGDHRQARLNKAFD